MTDETLFAVALEKPDAAARGAYLDSACTDPEQRQRIDGLLAALEKAGGFLERPAAAVSETDFASTRMFPSDEVGADDTTRLHGADGDEDTGDAIGFLAPAGRPDSLGRIGRYEVLEVLGRGGFGIVFRAFDESLQRVVAVKVLAPSIAATSPARKRFLREARSAAQVQHENVVRIYETGEEPLPYLAMEFVPGETLQDRLDRTGPLDVAETLAIGRQLAEGLAAAHAKGLIHRDIKPSNILIDTGPHQVKITDFGLARAADDASLTRSGVVAGTPMYMAPEQAKGEALDHRADLFSLGSVLYALLTGRPPFRAETTLAVLKRVADDTPRPMREVIPEVPEWLCRIVEKLHAKNPADRFQTAKEVADLLADCEKQLAAHKEVRDMSRIPATKVPPLAARSSRTWKWAAAALLVLLGGGLWFAPAAIRYADNRADVEFVSDPDVLEFSLTREGDAVAQSVDAGTNPTFKLPPGTFKVEAKCKPGRVVEHWEVTIHGPFYTGLFTSRAHPRGGETFVLGTNRGERFSLRPVLRDADPIPSPEKDGFVSLFNGKDLSGWEPNPNWTVLNNGVLSSVVLNRFSSLVSTRRDFENFHLRVEARINRDGNSGIFFRCPGGTWKQDWYEVQIADDSDPIKTGSLWGRGIEYAVKENPIGPNEWFLLEIIAIGNAITVKVNGKVTATWQDPNYTYTRGAFRLQQVGYNTVVQFRKIEIKELPPSSPAVPRTAAEVLPFLAGNWKAEWEELNPKLPPDQATGVGAISYELMAGGRLLRTRSVLGRRNNEEVVVLHTYDPGPGVLRMWQARSSGFSSGPSTGVFNPDNRSLTWTYTNPASKPSNHQFTFVDGNTVAIQLYHLDGTNIVRDGNMKLTRVSGPVTIPSLPLDPKRPEEMKVLDRLVGEWQSDVTVKNAATPDTPRIQTGRVKAESVLGGRFVEVLDANDMTNTTDYWLTGFDAGRKQYRAWFFSGSRGQVNELTGTWDEVAKALTWTSLDKFWEGRWTFKSENLREYRHLVKAPDGKTFTEAVGTARRVTNAPAVAVAPFDAAKAKAHQEQWAHHLGVKVEHTNSLGMKLRLIPPGEFTMGSSAEEQKSALLNMEQTMRRIDPQIGYVEAIRPLVAAEGPAHRVTLTQPYLLGTTEVTAAQFAAFVRATGHVTDAERDDRGGMVWGRTTHERGKEFHWRNPCRLPRGANHPVTQVSYNDALAFCKWLSAREGITYALPTEAQWEFACRAGTQSPWFTGSDPEKLEPYAWGEFRVDASIKEFEFHEVGKKLPNPFGLHDMLGNVQEWCLDWFSPIAYSTRPETDPPGPVNSSGDKSRAIRGGAIFLPHDLRSAIRRRANEKYAENGLGFRVAVVGNLKPQSPSPAVAPFDAAKAKEHQEQWANHLGAPVEVENSIGMKLRLVPPGKFPMGSTPKEIEEVLAETKEASKFLVKAEGPQRSVRISAPYYMGTFEVTQAEYQRVMGANPSDFAPMGKSAAKVEGIDTGRFPVENVSWDDAVEFCRRLSELPAEKAAGRTYRLATEAQWEYACRAGTTGHFHTGAALREADANFNLALGRPTTVGSFPANAFGLYDLHGNVFEWCHDWFAPDYRDLPALDPQGPNEGTARVVRGGNYGYLERYCRSAARDRFQPTTKRGGIGFRVVITGDLKPKPASPAPAGPSPIVLRKFDPAKDKPAPLWGGDNLVTVEDGAWRIENNTNMGNFKVLFDTLLDGIPKDGLIVFRAKVKVKANHKLAWGSIQLGIGDPSFHKYEWPRHLGDYHGDVPEWTQKEIRYPASVFHQKNPPQIPVYVGLNAAGVVWVKDAEVLHIPEGASPEPVKATGGPVKLRSFDPAKDKPIVGPGSDVKSVTVEEGALRVETGTAGVKAFTLILGEVVDGVPKDGLFVFRAKVKVKAGHKNTWGELQLNFTDPSFHGYDWPTERYRYHGDVSEWTQKEVRYPAAIFHKKNPPTVTMSAGLHEGVLWLKDVELWYVPEGAKLPANAAPDRFALAFDGTESMVQIPSLTFNDPDALTVEVWTVVKDTADPRKNYGLVTNAHNAGFVLGAPPDGDGKKLAFSIRSTSANTYVRAWEKQPVPRDQLVHLAGVYDGKGEIRFYVNGQLQSRAAVKSVKPSTAPVALGSNPINTVGNGKFYGRMNEVRISKGARYDADFTPAKRFDPDKDTIALYHFDEGTGTVLKDSSGNGHHGKIVGAKWVKADGSAIDPASVSPPPGAVVPFDAKAAEAHQEAWAKHLNTKVEFTDKKVGMEFRVIPPGDFQMGAKDDEVKPEIKKAEENKNYGWRLHVRSLKAEMPRHPVRITRPFALGKYEVTVGQFRKFVEETGYKTEAEQAGGYGVKGGEVVWGQKYRWNDVGYAQADNAPVWNVSPGDAVAFCKWLSEKDGRTFRLPTEAEWEWACRAGTDTRTFWDGEKAADAHKFAWGSAKSGRTPQPVGKLAQNAFGLHDICGNVWEWCSDWYNETYYKDAPTADPTGPLASAGGQRTRRRVQRGGGVDYNHLGLSSTARPVTDYKVVGFRVVCEIAGDVKLPPPPNAKEPPAVAALGPLREVVAKQEKARDDVKRRVEAGTASGIDLAAAEAVLVEARIRVAEEEKNTEDVADLLEELVTHRQQARDLIALRVKEGVEPPATLTAADVKLADAKARLFKLRPPEPPLEVAPGPRPLPPR